MEELLDMTIPSWKSERSFVKDKENFQKKLELMPAFVDRVKRTTEENRAKVIQSM